MPKLWEALLTLAILIAALAVGIIIFGVDPHVPGLPMGDRRAGERGIFCILQAAFHPLCCASVKSKRRSAIQNLHR